MRNLDKATLAKRSLIKKYRKEIWAPFISAVKNYRLIQEGDKIAVCISGGKDSMILAMLMQQLKMVTEIPFDLEFLTMDPGYNKENRQKIEDNARLLDIPIKIFETDVFDIANSVEKSPCYLCARMRRGYLYANARDLGCNKIALGHHMSDVIETTLMGMMYGSQIQGMLPRLKSTNFEGMELIRPLYCILEDDIISWAKYNELEFLRCACRFTEDAESKGKYENTSKRKEIKNLICEIKKSNPDVEHNLFKSIHNVCLDTLIGYKQGGVEHSFLERFSSDRKEVL